MSTGDLQNNLGSLKTELKNIRYGALFNENGIALGDPTAFLPLLHYVLLGFSKQLAEYIASRGHELYGKKDLRFLEGVYRLCRDEFNYKPKLTRDQFFSMGFAEQKLIFVRDLINVCKRKHADLTRDQRPGTAATPGAHSAAASSSSTAGLAAISATATSNASSTAIAASAMDSVRVTQAPLKSVKNKQATRSTSSASSSNMVAHASANNNNHMTNNNNDITNSNSNNGNGGNKSRAIAFRKSSLASKSVEFKLNSSSRESLIAAAAATGKLPSTKSQRKPSSASSTSSDARQSNYDGTDSAAIPSGSTTLNEHNHNDSTNRHRLSRPTAKQPTLASSTNHKKSSANLTMDDRQDKHGHSSPVTESEQYDQRRDHESSDKEQDPASETIEWRTDRRQQDKKIISRKNGVDIEDEDAQLSLKVGIEDRQGVERDHNLNNQDDDAQEPSGKRIWHDPETGEVYHYTDKDMTHYTFRGTTHGIGKLVAAASRQAMRIHNNELMKQEEDDYGASAYRYSGARDHDRRHYQPSRELQDYRSNHRHESFVDSEIRHDKHSPKKDDDHLHRFPSHFSKPDVNHMDRYSRNDLTFSSIVAERAVSPPPNATHDDDNEHSHQAHHHSSSHKSHLHGIGNHIDHQDRRDFEDFDHERHRDHSHRQKDWKKHHLLDDSDLSGKQSWWMEETPAQVGISEDHRDVRVVKEKAKANQSTTMLSSSSKTTNAPHVHRSSSPPTMSLSSSPEKSSKPWKVQRSQVPNSEETKDNLALHSHESSHFDSEENDSFSKTHLWQLNSNEQQQQHDFRSDYNKSKQNMGSYIDYDDDKMKRSHQRIDLDNSQSTKKNDSPLKNANRSSNSKYNPQSKVSIIDSETSKTKKKSDSTAPSAVSSLTLASASTAAAPVSSATAQMIDDPAMAAIIKDQLEKMGSLCDSFRSQLTTLTLKLEKFESQTESTLAKMQRRLNQLEERENATKSTSSWNGWTTAASHHQHATSSSATGQSALKKEIGNNKPQIAPESHRQDTMVLPSLSRLSEESSPLGYSGMNRSTAVETQASVAHQHHISSTSSSSSGAAASFDILEPPKKSLETTEMEEFIKNMTERSHSTQQFLNRIRNRKTMN